MYLSARASAQEAYPFELLRPAVDGRLESELRVVGVCCCGARPLHPLFVCDCQPRYLHSGAQAPCLIAQKAGRAHVQGYL